MSDVNQYVSAMQKTGTKSTGASNTEKSQLERELIEFYKVHKAKGQQVIDTAEANGEPQFHSPNHAMHYNCAVIAIRGYPFRVKPKPVEKPASAEANKKSEMDKLRRAGWKPVNEQITTETILLVEREV